MKSNFKNSPYILSLILLMGVFSLIEHFMLVKWSPILNQDMGAVQMYGMGGLK